MEHRLFFHERIGNDQTSFALGLLIQKHVLTRCKILSH
jgi:hypothetical protein